MDPCKTKVSQDSEEKMETKVSEKRLRSISYTRFQDLCEFSDEDFGREYFWDEEKV